MTTHRATGVFEPSTHEWDAFVAGFQGDTLAQTTIWARTKGGGDHHTVVGYRDNGNLVAGCLLLRRSVGPVHIAYAPRGPLIAAGAEHVAEDLLSATTAVSRRWGPSALILQPLHQPPALARALRRNGFSTLPLGITTTATVEIPLDAGPEMVFASLRSSRRRNIRKAERAGVEVRRGTEQDLDLFHELHAATAARQGFAPMSRQYLMEQWRALGVAGVQRIYIAELEGCALAAATVTAFGDRVVFKLAGLNDDPVARATRASELLHWRIIAEAIEDGFSYYDLGGFDRAAAQLIAAGQDPPESIRSSASQFKLGFGGEVRVLPEAQCRLSPSALRLLQSAAMSLLGRSPRARALAGRLRQE